MRVFVRIKSTSIKLVENHTDKIPGPKLLLQEQYRWYFLVLVQSQPAISILQLHVFSLLILANTSWSWTKIILIFAQSPCLFVEAHPLVDVPQICTPSPELWCQYNCKSVSQLQWEIYYTFNSRKLDKPLNIAMPVGTIFRFLRHSELSKTNMKIFIQSIIKAYKIIL